MDAELKAKWVKALRSGEYEQGKNFLCADNRYCCLGVLARVQGLDPNACRMTDAFSDAIELLQEPASAGVSYAAQQTLSSLNDGTLSGHPMPFAEIADYIEQNL